MLWPGQNISLQPGQEKLWCTAGRNSIQANALRQTGSVKYHVLTRQQSGWIMIKNQSNNFSSIRSEMTQQCPLTIMILFHHQLRAGSLGAEMKMELFFTVTVLVLCTEHMHWIRKYWNFPFLQIQLSRFFDLSLNKGLQSLMQIFVGVEMYRKLCINIDYRIVKIILFCSSFCLIFKYWISKYPHIVWLHSIYLLILSSVGSNYNQGKAAD